MQGSLVPTGGEHRVGVGLRHARRRLRQFLHEREDRPQLAVDGSRREVLDQAIYRFRLNAEQLRCCAVPAVAVRTRP
jgi:hypothetical protein